MSKKISSTAIGRLSAVKRSFFHERDIKFGISIGPVVQVVLLICGVLQIAYIIHGHKPIFHFVHG